MSDIITSFDGKTRFIPTKAGGRAEMLIPVNGIPTWREAQWENDELCRLCSSRHGVKVDRVPILRPILRKGEELMVAYDGMAVCIMSLSR